jgi:acyl carrier protein
MELSYPPMSSRTTTALGLQSNTVIRTPIKCVMGRSVALGATTNNNGFVNTAEAGMNMAEKVQSISFATLPEDVANVRRNLATLITKALGLEVLPEEIDLDAPLYGEGLGLDSIDILEIALVIAKEYGIQLKADSEENKVIFSSLNALAEFVVRQRTR